MKIKGRVDENIPRIELCGQKGSKPVLFTVDTGFTDCLSASVSDLRKNGWRLEPRGLGYIKVADGRFIDTTVYRSTISWFGKECEVRIYDSGINSLGFGLLCNTRIKLTETEVVIERL
ncbi:MAG: hypothetical protein AB1630_04130 [bacterium]